MTRSAIVAGAGIAGLAAAIGLRQAGYAVTVCERAAVLAPAGAALSLWPNAIAALRRLGAAERIEAEAAPITRMRLATKADATILDQRPGAGARLPTRSLLQAALLDALGDVDLRLGTGIVAVSQDDAGVTAVLGDGQRLGADLLVAADGIWSPIGSTIAGGAPRPSGYRGVMALAEANDGVTPGLASEYWGTRERFGLLDIGGGRAYWFFIGDGDPRDAAGGWPDPIAAIVAATPDAARIPFVVHARPAPRRLGDRRILCVGDAAHPMEPNHGQGGCQGLEDAVALWAAAARAAPADIVPAFEALRLARVRTVVRRSAEGALGAHAPAPIRLAYRSLLRLAPAAVTRRVLAGMHAMPDYR